VSLTFDCQLSFTEILTIRDSLQKKPQILLHRIIQLVSTRFGHLIMKPHCLCAKWRVITTFTERLQWILPWVRWKQICWITLGKLHTNWHHNYSLTQTLTNSMELSHSLEA